ncbi:MAG: peptidoglycan recognition family protein [Pseudomonadota bacterium]
MAAGMVIGALAAISISAIVTASAQATTAPLAFAQNTTGETTSPEIADADPAGVQRPPIVSRAEWKAKPAKTSLMRRQTPREIIIHHTSVRQQPKISLERKMRGLQGFSMRPGKVGRRKKPAWGDGPYHFYIGVSGRIAEGRDIRYAGDTNTKYNTKNRIQVVLEGQFDRERPNRRQLTALRQLTRWLAVTYDISADALSSHNDHASTNCPGKHLKAYLPTLRAAIAN